MRTRERPLLSGPSGACVTTGRLDGEASRPKDEAPPAIASAALRSIYDYYRSLAPDGTMPGRRHIDPVDLRALLPHIVLADVLPDDFRLRLVGTRVVDIWGKDHTGLTFGDLPQTEFVALLRRSYARAREERRVVHTCTPHPLPSLVFYERLTFPLSSDGETVDMVMGAVDYVQLDTPRPITFHDCCDHTRALGSEDAPPTAGRRPTSR
ncbi:PAS domain-containing protein [Arenibaculum sp.]|jgi:hypothetical protein|uniref:PAS domain-containing protein n=1 Tax=Arenibaculum sp. TaxID=2865862 RepID=UPI002E0E998D|nr:PAS domain-containing protein [Arenibaculum sp.]